MDRRPHFRLNAFLLGLGIALSAPIHAVLAEETARPEARPPSDARIAYRLVETLLPKDERAFCFSPAGAVSLLSLLALGSAGEARASIEKALGRDVDTLVDPFAYKDALNDVVGTINAIWFDETLNIRAAYSHAARERFAARLAPVDLSKKGVSPAALRRAVLAGEASPLPLPGKLGPGTRMVAANGFALRGAWDDPFDEALTRDRPFYAPDGRVTMVPTMHDIRAVEHAETETLSMARLPMSGGLIRATLIVKRDPDDARSTLSMVRAAGMEALAATAFRTVAHVNLSIPRFEIAADGVIDGAVAEGDFAALLETSGALSAITGQPLTIGAITHGARVTLTEEGVAAIAETQADIVATEAFEPGLTLAFDRPFVIVVEVTKTGLPLIVAGIAALPAETRAVEAPDATAPARTGKAVE